MADNDQHGSQNPVAKEKLKCFQSLKEHFASKPCQIVQMSLWMTVRIVLVLLSLYMFICSLNLMSDSFRLIAGASLGSLFSDNELLQNPIVDLMIGVLFTVLVQSSSTTTAIMISMTAANVIPVDNAIYVVFGSEIGTSITNTLISMVYMGDKENFRRAFAGASIQCTFNWLSVLIFFPLEASTHVLRRTADILIGDMGKVEGCQFRGTEILGTIIKPLTEKIIKLDKELLLKIAMKSRNETANYTTLLLPGNDYLLANTGLEDRYVGVLLLLMSLTTALCCLALIGKTMHSIFAEQFAASLRKHINSDLPGPWKPFTGYLFILIGALVTCIIQSSTIFTSTLTPMVGIGMISVERVFPLILGANLGAVSESILSALAQDSTAINAALRVAIVQVLFNVLGVLIFYPIPFMRNVVTDTGKWLGEQTFNYRWFPFVYIFVLFFFLPLAAICLSLAGETVFICLGAPITVFIVTVSVINALQSQKPEALPDILQTWDWLPEPLHSLEPYDKRMQQLCCCCPKANETKPPAYTSTTSNKQIHVL